MSDDELPPGWTTARLDELTSPGASIVYGILQPGPHVPDGVPYVRPTEIGDDRINVQDIRRTTLSIAAEYERSKLEAGDTLLSIVGTIGKVARLPPPLHGGNITQSSVRIRLNREVVEPSFIESALRSPELRRVFDEIRLGSAVQRLNVAQVRELNLRVAPLNEQRRIVAKLDALLARSKKARAHLDRVPKLLDALKRSILAAAFRGDLTADWRAAHPDVEPASALLERIRAERRRRWEDELRAKGKDPKKAKYEEPDAFDEATTWDLPPTWAWASIADIGDVQLGRQRAPQYESGAHSRPYLRVANIKDDRIEYEDVLSMDFDPDDFRRYALLAGDILLSEGQSLSRVGESAIYDGHIDGLCYQKTLHRFRRAEPAPAVDYCQLVFRHHVHNEVFRKYAPITTNIAHLTLERIRTVPFPLAPTLEQAVIVDRTRAALRRVDALARAADSIRRRSSSLESSTLASAFRGELVPQDPNDEPAEAMLARLRAARDAAPAPKPRRKPKAKPG